MVGALGNRYDSIENLSGTYMQSDKLKEAVLNPKITKYDDQVPLLLANDVAPVTGKFYRCYSYCGYYVTDDPTSECPSCKNKMSTLMPYVAGGGGVKGAVEGGGFVKGVVTYMVMDDLVVKPMSTISSIAMLNKFNVKEVGALEEKMVSLEMKEMEAERERVLNDPSAIIPAAFVSFKLRWGAAVCAQTEQSHNPTLWLTDWAPEPRDIYWENLAIPFVELNLRRLLMAIALFCLTFCFMVPIAFVQTLANIEGIQKVFSFLKPLIEMGSVKSVIQGFLPGIILKIFLILLPTIIMTMSKIEGYTAYSALQTRSAGKYHLFLLVNVFLGSIIAGTALQQLKEFSNQSPTEIPQTVGVSIPMKATFFITYVMVDGWSGIAAEILRLVPLIIFHLKNAFWPRYLFNSLSKDQRGSSLHWLHATTYTTTNVL